jgi:3-deoxy-manno-octulosonate cytidylyltransferase (CMP-KDO synthetase)
MRFSVLIPARYASMRLPGKPLSIIAGKPMIQRVYERACQSSAARVVIATDDERIRAAAAAFGAEVCKTATHHPSGTDRLEEAASRLGLSGDEIVVNVQGDEPLIPPAVIDHVAQELADHADCAIATLCEPLADIDQFLSPNVVKVLRDTSGKALYFSRAPVPWPRDAFMRTRDALPPDLFALRHIGIYAYRVDFLQRFVTWPPGRLESIESLEQLRALERGVGIHVADTPLAVPGGIDTPEDLQRLDAQLRAKGE